MANLIKVVVTKKDSVPYSTAKSLWVNTKYITEVEISGGNGSTFRYAPPYQAVVSEYITTTPASDINTASNA